MLLVHYIYVVNIDSLKAPQNWKFQILADIQHCNFERHFLLNHQCGPVVLCRQHTSKGTQQQGYSLTQKIRHSAKSAGGSLQVTSKHTCTLSTWLWIRWCCKLVHGCIVYTDLAIVAILKHFGLISRRANDKFSYVLKTNSVSLFQHHCDLDNWSRSPKLTV